MAQSRLHHIRGGGCNCVSAVRVINWLVDEIGTGGVTIEYESAVGLETNCAAPGVHIRWYFKGAWEAITLERDSAVAEQGVGDNYGARQIFGEQAHA